MTRLFAKMVSESFRYLIAHGYRVNDSWNWETRCFVGIKIFRSTSPQLFYKLCPRLFLISELRLKRVLISVISFYVLLLILDSTVLTKFQILYNHLHVYNIILRGFSLPFLFAPFKTPILASYNSLEKITGKT